MWPRACKKTFTLVLGFALGVFVTQLYLTTRLDEHVLLQAQGAHLGGPGDSEYRLWHSQQLRAPLNASLRYRYLSRELAPRKLLLIGVVTAQRYLDTRARGVFQTWAKDAIPDVYFYTGRSPDDASTITATTTDLPVVSLADVDDNQYPPQRKVFGMLRHMFDHHIDAYDFFMRADDDVYVKVDRLRDLLEGVNPAQDVYMGSPGFGRESDQGRIRLGGQGDRYCMGGPGVIFSRSALRRMAPHLNECLSDVVVSYNEDVEVGRCTYSTLKVQCTWAWEVS